ncbi:MAG: hypothetical protein OIF38_15760 [Cellvibrionaceae bacterium]|nr:hypothetical protein [Cellvibrionaceae bacterium]
MNINLTLIGQVMVFWVPFATLMIALLARKKSDSPVLLGVIGFIASFIPPLSLLLMVVLALKNNVTAGAQA